MNVPTSPLRRIAWTLLLALPACGAPPSADPIPSPDSDTPPQDEAMTSSLLNPVVHSEISKDWFPERAAAARDSRFGTVPSVAVVEDGPVRLGFRINGFPLTCAGTLRLDEGRTGELETGYVTLTPVHPYFLCAGVNAVHVLYGLDTDAIAEGDAGPFHGEAAITLWDYVGATSNRELVRARTPDLTAGAEENEGKLRTEFRVAHGWPVWSWTTAADIEAGDETTASLYAAVTTIHGRIRELCDAPDRDATEGLAQALRASTSSFIAACEMRGKPYRLIDQILEAAAAQALPGEERGSLAWQPLPDAGELELELFGGSRLARLRAADDRPFLVFAATSPSGPRGMSGQAVLAFDAWFRSGAEGRWELDALVPRTAPGTWSDFELSGDERRELFLLTGY